MKEPRPDPKKLLPPDDKPDVEFRRIPEQPDVYSAAEKDRPLPGLPPRDDPGI